MTANAIYSNFDAIARKAEALGKEQGKGAVAQPEFAIQLAIAASEGAVDQQKKQAEKLWEKFQQGRATGTAGKEPSSTANRKSDCNTIATVAIAFPDHLPSMLVDVREVMTKAKENGLKPGAWDAMMKVTRAQKKAEHPLTRDEWMDVLRGEEKEPKTEAEVLAALVKTMEGILNGKEPKDGEGEGKPAYRSEELVTAIDAIRQRLVILEVMELNRKAAALTLAMQNKGR